MNLHSHGVSFIRDSLYITDPNKAPNEGEIRNSSNLPYLLSLFDPAQMGNSMIPMIPVQSVHFPHFLLRAIRSKVLLFTCKCHRHPPLESGFAKLREATRLPQPIHLPTAHGSRLPAAVSSWCQRRFRDGRRSAATRVPFTHPNPTAPRSDQSPNKYYLPGNSAGALLGMFK